jgi:hypothetical protein
LALFFQQEKKKAMKREKDQHTEDQTLGQAGQDRGKSEEGGHYEPVTQTQGREETEEEAAAAEQQRKEALTERD